MEITPEILRTRTRQFALRVIRLVRILPRNIEGRVIGQQLLRCGTAVAANYRAACRARSRAEFIAKLGIVVEEADETVFWLDMLLESETIKAHHIHDLAREAIELLRIFSAARQTTRERTNIQLNRKSEIANHQ